VNAEEIEKDQEGEESGSNFSAEMTPFGHKEEEE